MLNALIKGVCYTHFMKNLTKLTLFVFITLSCATKQYTADQKAAETKKLNALLDKFHEEEVDRYPTWQTYLGLKTNYDKLDTYTEAYSLESLELSKKTLDRLEKNIDFDALTEQGKLSYQLYEKEVKEQG